MAHRRCMQTAVDDCLRDVGRRTWESQIMSTRRHRLCTLSGGRDDRLGKHDRPMQQPRRLSQVIVLRLDSLSPKTVQIG